MLLSTSRSGLIQACRISRLKAVDVGSTRAMFSLPNFPNVLPFSSPESDSEPNTYHERKILPYSQRQLYEVVADVDSYSKEGDMTPYTVEAELAIGFLAVEESYVSKVTCTPYEKVEAIGSSQLFKELTTTWRMQPASPSSPHPSHGSLKTGPTPSESGPTLLSIDLSYSFANPLYAALASKVFGAVSSQMVEAFEKRCLEIYGEGRA
ncbi:hypothetical protein FRC05_000078 [Tulasnella sp. 425]|nr:hypothetical protein FRC05_000078 [Tulasnella sp. 425]